MIEITAKCEVNWNKMNKFIFYLNISAKNKMNISIVNNEIYINANKQLNTRDDFFIFIKMDFNNFIQEKLI